jgi:hypothetical protein
MCVGDDNATQSICEESGAVRKTSLNPEYAVTQALEKRCGRVYSKVGGGRDGTRRCTFYCGIVVRQRNC